jgi:hypothetical protein
VNAYAQLPDKDDKLYYRAARAEIMSASVETAIKTLHASVGLMLVRSTRACAFDTPVEKPDADWRNCDLCSGVSDRSELDRAAQKD